eukprot:405691-Pyramimonas_sp.AAC.1
MTHHRHPISNNLYDLNPSDLHPRRMFRATTRPCAAEPAAGPSTHCRGKLGQVRHVDRGAVGHRAGGARVNH